MKTRTYRVVGTKGGNGSNYSTNSIGLTYLIQNTTFDILPTIHEHKDLEYWMEGTLKTNNLITTFP